MRTKREPATHGDFLGPLERRVMAELWTHGARTVGQVVEALNASSVRKLAYTTVMTILVRLHEKAYVSRQATGRSYTYEAAMDETTLAGVVGRRELSRLIERFGATELARFAQDLAPETGLTGELRELADGEQDARR